MAKILGKDQATYSKEREGFLRDLQHFHEIRGTPFKRPPTLGGKEVDLYLLYTLVTSQGGWIRVNSKNSWSELMPFLKFPVSCVNGSVALKQIYLRYLDRWEKVHFLHEEPDRGSDDDEESRHKRWSARSLHSVPYTYNYSQHNVTDTNREFHHLATNLYKPSDYDRLGLSLISPLPNEQDFAINVCTLLSNDGKHTLKLEKHPRLVDYLLGHAGIFSNSSLRQLFLHFYNDIRKTPIHNFWKDVLESREFLDLTDENKFKPAKQAPAKEPTKTESLLVGDELNRALLALQVIPAEPADERLRVPEENVCDIVAETGSGCELDRENNNCDNFKLKLDSPEDYDLFCLRRSLGTQDYVGQRVLQIATILRNLSFIEENIPVLVKSVSFVRFLLLCSSSRWNVLRNLGADMLSNIAAEFVVRDLHGDLLASNMIKIATNGLKSQDRASCLCSLEVLNKLSQNEQNEDVMMRSLQSTVYKRVCSFLTIHDVMMLIYTLECLYSLSSLGERSCTFIVNNHGVIDTLVSLVTVEGKSYGPKACIGMKLVETLPSSNSQPQQPQQSSTTSSTTGGTSSSTTSAASSPTPSVTTSASTPIVSSSPTPKMSTPATPVRPVQIAPQRLIPITPTSTTSITLTTVPQSNTVMTPQQLIQQQHAHQQAIHENEQFALAWLRATYEPCINGRIDHQELYKHYLNSCSKIGRRGVISPLHFPRCVRSIFGGTVGPNPMKPANPSDPQYYDGIKAMAHPHLSQALLGCSSSNMTTTSTTIVATSAGVNASKESQVGQTASSTSLIKSLLATKVNDCMSTVSMRTATDCQNVAQVAARQQRLLAQQSGGNSSEIQVKKESQKSSRLNGVRQLFADNEVGDPSVSSTTQFTGLMKGKKEPPQPPPPPLAPLSNNVRGKSQRIENEDSDSIGNNSLASSSGVGTVGIGGVSSTEDGDNSLTSFEGLLNGIPNIEHPLIEDSNSKDSVKLVAGGEITMDKPLRLADLLEKKFEKNSPMLNGSLGKELRLGEKSLDLVENHIEKALSRDIKQEIDVKQDMDIEEIQIKDQPLEKVTKLKRSASDELVEIEHKKPLLSSNVNGSSMANSPAPDSVSSSNGDEGPSTVSTAAAKLFADIAADILEDEDEEQLMQEAQATPQIIEAAPAPVQMPVQAPLQQIIVDNNQQMMLQRQIIVSQSQMQTSNQVVISTGTQLKTQTGQTVIVQNAAAQRPVMLQQSNTGQFLLSQGLQGQMQLVASSQPGQYVLQGGGGQGTYVVAQPQTAVVHGQPQTVLVAQTSQQQGTGAKTIIILQQQQQQTPTAATHHQKVVVTPQGQQMVVTQVPRPVVHASTVSNNVTAPAQKAVKAIASSQTAANGTTSEGNKCRIIRDLSTPYICEWGDCCVDQRFKSANDVFLHACAVHCPTGNEEVICQWDRCDNMKRKRFSLMTHLQDKHCTTEIMKQGLTRRKKAAHSTKAETSATTSSSASTTAQHPGYAADAALHAIKRHALEFVNPKELQLKPTPKSSNTGLTAVSPRAGPPPPPDQDDNEGPVTKSIRLTASLILRNLVIYSSHCKRYLKSYEAHLANVALSNVESSRTIAQVLYDMNDGSTHR
nr:AT-rich interactive domain-containing protein 2 isoform X5 [Leptinotarsa decemlineata]